MLCKVCEQMLVDIGREPLGSNAVRYGEIVHPTPRPIGLHHPTSASLAAAAESNCHICTVIVNQIRDQHPDWPHLKERTVEESHQFERTFYSVAFPGPQYDYSREGTLDHPSAIGFRFHEPRNNYWGLSLHSAFVRFDIIPASEFESFYRSDPREVEDAKFNEGLAKHWFAQCKHLHRRCDPQQTELWTPTRLIDVGDTHPSSSLKLKIFDQPEGGIEYFTLSHCWGDAEIFKLEQRNLASLTDSIPLDLLPKTFQDAIHVTRKLGGRYIWIDSLCIIQDSTEDWNREALMMNKIYKYSFLNIAATGSRDSYGGLFFPNTYDLITPPKVDLSFEFGIVHSTVVLGQKTWKIRGDVRRKTYCLMRTEPSWADELEKSRLLRRAWVFQERLLSPRTLHFHKAQLFWECRDVQACEAYPSGVPSKKFLYWDRKVSIGKILWGKWSKSASQSANSETVGSNCASSFWVELVEAYSDAGLTYTRDKMVAISGIATEIQSQNNDQYLAGLWRDSLLYELLWCVDPSKRNSPRGTRASGYRAPSWSWASIDGPISMKEALHSNGISSLPLVSFVDAQVRTRGHQGTDDVISGFIKIKGRLGHCKWRGVTASSEGSGAYVEDFAPIPPIGDRYADAIKGMDCTIDFDDAKDTTNCYESMYCLPIIAFIDTTRGQHGDYTIGLILIKNDQGQFTRIARFQNMTEDAMLKCRAWPEEIVEII